MKKAKAYWNRFWHCLIPKTGHRMITITTKESGKYFSITNYIGCECGKNWYAEKDIEILLKEFEGKSM